MITGFNTDVEFQGVTYHVQTEDKGLATPLILSLVYNRGTILASKRSPYDDLLNNFDEKILAERLQKQHKLICAAIRAGRIEDLKQMTAKDSAVRRNESVQQTEQKNEPQIELKIERKEPEAAKRKPETPAPPVPTSIPAPRTFKEKFVIQPELPRIKIAEAAKERKTEPVVQKPIAQKPKEIINSKSVTETVQLEPIIEAVQIIEDDIVIPAEAVEVIVDDSVIKATSVGKLQVKIFGDENFKSGEKRTISIIVFRGSVQFGLKDAQVMVKVIGSEFRPLIFHSKSDTNGVANVHLQMPQFKSGRAVLLIKAISDGEEAEFRRVIRHR